MTEEGREEGKVRFRRIKASLESPQEETQKETSPDVSSPVTPRKLRAPITPTSVLGIDPREAREKRADDLETAREITQSVTRDSGLSYLDPESPLAKEREREEKEQQRKREEKERQKQG